MCDQIFQAAKDIPLRGLEYPARWAVQAFSKHLLNLQLSTGIRLLGMSTRSSKPAHNHFQTHARFRNSKPDFPAIPTVPSFRFSETEHRHDI